MAEGTGNKSGKGCQVSAPTRIQAEFTRQAETLAAAAVFTDTDVLARILAQVAPSQAMTVLDVGCGPGILAAALAPWAGKVVGLDVTPKMVESARARCRTAGLTNVHCALGQAETLPFAEGTFAAVVTRATLHHVPEPGKVLREMARVVRGGGRVVVADISASEDPAAAAVHNALEVLRDPSHVRMLSASELQREIQAAGLRVLTTSAWDMSRTFEEWMQITNAPERAGPLCTLMRALANAGVRAGIDLQESGETVRFTHRWCLVAAERG